MARSIWTGSISFGLVNVPVRVHAAIREHDVHFHQIAPDGSRVHYQRVSEKTGKVVEYEDIKKGFETSKNKWAVFTQKELADLAPTSTKTIDIEDFVPLEEIDPIYYQRTYHLAPKDAWAAHTYALLAAVMEDRGHVGIGTVVIRERPYLAAVRPYGKGLAMSTMLFADEIVAQSAIDGIPRAGRRSAPARSSSPPRSSTRSRTTGTRSATTTTTNSNSGLASRPSRRARCSSPRRRRRRRRRARSST